MAPVHLNLSCFKVSSYGFTINVLTRFGSYGGVEQSKGKERRGEESHSEGRKWSCDGKRYLVIVQSSPGQDQRGMAALEFLLDSPNLEYSM